MTDLSNSGRALAPALLTLLSACFSAVSTAMMRLNHYRPRLLCAVRFPARPRQIQPGTLARAAEDPYFIPEVTLLNSQLLNSQRLMRRIGLAVDEHGDIEGLVAQEDLPEEIVGGFTTDITATVKIVQPRGMAAIGSRTAPMSSRTTA